MQWGRISYKRWRKNKAREECAGNIAFARLRYIKYNYSDSEKRAQVETYDNTVHAMVCARSNRRETYVDAMQCTYMQRKALVHSARSLDVARDSRVYFLDAPTILCIFLASIILSILSPCLLVASSSVPVEKISNVHFLSLTFFMPFLLLVFFLQLLPLSPSYTFYFFCLFLFVFAYCVYTFCKYAMSRFLSRIITLNGQYIACQWYSPILTFHTRLPRRP